jgi:uncharacterized peroxidase-related enzyme
MKNFDIHTIETAEASAAKMLDDINRAYGFIPNLYGIFAESPAALRAYMSLGKIFDESSFSATERQLIILAASRINECKYCIAAHTVVAGMQKVPANVVEAVREDRPIRDERLEALRTFTTSVVEKRGWATDDEVSAFLAAGFSRAQVLEVIVGVSFKTLSNYTNHIADTPLDEAFKSARWSPGTTDRNEPTAEVSSSAVVLT